MGGSKRISLDRKDIDRLMDLVVDEIREINNDLRYLFEDDRIQLQKQVRELQLLWNKLTEIKGSL